MPENHNWEIKGKSNVRKEEINIPVGLGRKMKRCFPGCCFFLGLFLSLWQITMKVWNLKLGEAEQVRVKSKGSTRPGV